MRDSMSLKQAWIVQLLFGGMLCLIFLGLSLFLILRDGRPPFSEPADPAGLTRHMFTLDGSEFELLMPPEYRLTVEDESQVRFTLSDQRLDRSVIVSAAAPAMRFAEGDRSVRLKSGYRLQYVVAPDLGAGSGGTIAQLVGQMKAGSLLVTVECHDQDELAPDPGWCISYLHHLKLTQALP
ncbi:MAG: hypothetical protein JXA21_01865 [Anaerolineae bacterium]|nr:hypothetical protein [Anaerolineae bacterium]